MARRSLIEAVFALVVATAGLQAVAQDVLPPEQAFPYTVEADGSRLVVKFAVLDGYYLYRERFGFETATPGIELAPAVFPVGEIHSDEFFGEQETYRRKFEIALPYRRTAAVDNMELAIRLQGCADIGLCYPPQDWTSSVALPAGAPVSAAPRTTRLFGTRGRR